MSSTEISPLFWTDGGYCNESGDKGNRSSLYRKLTFAYNESEVAPIVVNIIHEDEKKIQAVIPVDICKKFERQSRPRKVYVDNTGKNAQVHEDVDTLFAFFENKLPNVSGFDLIWKDYCNADGEKVRGVKTHRIIEFDIEAFNKSQEVQKHATDGEHTVKVGDEVGLIKEVTDIWLASPKDGEDHNFTTQKPTLVKLTGKEIQLYEPNDDFHYLQVETVDMYLGNDTITIEKGWLKSMDFTEEFFSPYHWNNFGFEILDAGEEYIYKVKNAQGNTNSDSPFLSKIWNKFNIEPDNVIEANEVNLALKVNETRYEMSRIVAKHKSEWALTEAEIKPDVENFYNAQINEAIEKDKLPPIINKMKEKKQEYLDALNTQVTDLMFWEELKRIEYIPQELENNERQEQVALELKALGIIDYPYKLTTANDPSLNEVAVDPVENDIHAPQPDPVEVVEEPETPTENEETIPERVFPSGDDIFHFHPIAFINHMKLIFGEAPTGECYCNKDFTVDDVKKIVKTVTGKEEIWQGRAGFPCPITDKSYDTLVKELNTMFTKYEINECIQKISFLAQVGAETGMFRQSVEESSSSTLSSQSVYKGRGIIQLTGNKDDSGFYNAPGVYQKYADYIGDESIVTTPNTIAENIHYTIDSAGWYFSNHKKVPKWSSATGANAVNNKKKRNYFSKALGKSLNKTSLLINEDAKYFWLQSKVINGYSPSHYLEKHPNGWDDRKENFNLLRGLFKINTECSNNPNKLDFTNKAPWMKLVIEEAYSAAFIKENKHPVSAMVKKYHNYNNYFDNPETTNYIEDKQDAWCASFANWILAEAGQKHIKSPASQGVLTAEGTNFVRVTEPSFGVIVLMTNYRQDTGASIGKGHMTFLYGKESNGNLVCLGGNQGDRIKFSRYKQTGVSSTRKIKIGGVKVTIEQKFNGFFIPKDYTIIESDKNIKIIDVDNMNSSLSGSTLTNTNDNNESTL